MRRTRTTSIVVAALLGVVVGILLETALAATGNAILIPPIAMAVTLTAIGVIVVVAAVPVGRSIRSRHDDSDKSEKQTKPTKPVNPFYALRVVVLAKSASLVGALLCGAAVGALIYLLGRTVLPSGGAFAHVIAAAVGAALMLAGGLIAEYLCTLPPDDHNEADLRDGGEGLEQGG